jgi:hypothetical protein
MDRNLALIGLDRVQLGHLRHFANLARQLPNQWDLMKGKGYGQEDFGGYRFQLAYMAYALALTHRHRLPAAPGFFKPIFALLVEKILLPEVWMYWRDVSRGGSVFNAHLAAKYQEEWDPVRRDNIMYSAYVQSMALLYDYLFDDHRYAEPGALTFRYWSYFWGGSERRFEYDQKSLNDHIYQQMVDSGYLGVACEPNCVFQICNQPAILGFRMHDLVYGGDRAEEVTRRYEEAWKQFGRVGRNGHYHVMLSEDTKTIRENVGRAPWVDAWCGTLMNMWNRDFVHAHYPQQIRELLIPGPNGTISVAANPRPLVMGHTIVSDDCDYGWVAAWSSEMGDGDSLTGLLEHADRFMAPRWVDGGLFYPRNDILLDADGNRTLIEPMSGNVLLGYARLNIADGLWKLYNEPWDRSRFAEPSITAVAQDVDVARAFFHREEDELHFSVARLDEVCGDGCLTIGNVLGRGSWRLSCDESEVARGERGSVIYSGEIRLEVTGEDLVLYLPKGFSGACTMAFRSV